MLKPVLARITGALLLAVIISRPALPQSGCTAGGLRWSASGWAGDASTGPGGDAFWQQIIAQQEALYGGAPTCTYTWISSFPAHWYGECQATGYTCPGAASTQPIYPTNAPSLPCGKGNCEAQAGQPINLTNGNVWITHRDYSLPGLGGGLAIERTWNSLWANYRDALPASGMFGDSWRSPYEERLMSFDTDFVKYYRVNGDGWWFQWNTSTQNYQLTNPPNQHGSLVFDTGTSRYTITFMDGSKRVFDGSGYLTTIVDRNGNQTSITYDGSRRITQVVDAASRTLTFAYANASFPLLATSALDATGNIANYAYDASGRLSQVARSDGSQFNFTYDSNGLITAVTDAQSKVLESHTYDTSRRGLTCQRVGGVDLVTVSYPSTTSTTLQDSLGNGTTYNYISRGFSQFISSVSGPTCASCGAANTTSFAYDVNGNRTSSMDANGYVTNYTYDSLGNVLTRSNVVSGNTLTWTYTYNGFREVLTATDPLGHVTTNTYDANGNLLTVTTPWPDGVLPGSVTTFTYDPKGQMLTMKDSRNNVTTLTDTAAGLIGTVKDAQNNTTTFTYDARGNRLTSTDPLNNTTTFTYDSMNRLTKITYPDNTTTQFAYDTRGRRASVTDANSKITTYTYDDADRLLTVKDAANNTTAYAYDTESNLISITDANNHQTVFHYNPNRWLTQTTFPSTLSENYTYDLAGNLKTKVDRKSQTITYTYDELNRLTKKSYPDSTAVNYTYDKVGRLTQVSDPTGTYTFTYDNMDRLTGTTTSYAFLAGRNFTTSYSYDAASNRTGFTDPEGGAAAYVYDTLNRVTALTPPAAISSGSFGFSYDALSRRTSLTRPNNVTTNYAYDTLSRLLSVLHQAGASTIDGATYTVDAAGNRTSKTDRLANVTSSYGYDAVYQLLQATQGATTTESYTYDPVGNRLSSLGVSPYSYNVSNQLTAKPGVTYTYDNNGNTLTKVTSSGTTSFAWDFENRLTSVTLPGTGGTVTFKYDPFGRRIYKSSSSGTSVYLYDGPNVAEEVDQSGNVLARYTQDSGIDQVRAELRSGTTSYYEQDGLGTVTSLSNAAGALAQTYTFDSFGNQTASSGSLTNSFRYTGREFDPETNLYYYRARYYDPNSGRFISEDPKRFQADVNFYPYVSNSPTGHLDPFGWSKCKSGACADCPGGKWVSGALTFEAYASAGVASAGGLVFAGVFMCTSNPSFNLPFYTVCGFGGAGLSPRPPLTSPPKKLFGGGAGAGGAIVRCTGATCREDMEGPETGGFVQLGPFYGFKEGGASGVSCYGGGGGFDFGLSLGGFKCTTQVGKSWTF